MRRQRLEYHSIYGEDAGDALIAAHIAAGAEPLDYEKYEDLSTAHARQMTLNRMDAAKGNTIRPLLIDGLVGKDSLNAAFRLGFKRWRDVPLA